MPWFWTEEVSLCVSSLAFPPHGSSGTLSSTTMASLPNAVYRKEQGQFSCSQCPHIWVPFTHIAKPLYWFVQVRHRALSSDSDCCRRNMKGRGQLFCWHPLKTGFLSPLTTGSVLMCFPGRVQSPLSCVLQLVWDRASFLTLVTPGTAFSPATGFKRWKEESIFPLHMLPHGRQGGSGLLLSHFRVDFPISQTVPGSVLVCCLDEVHDL